MGAGQQPAKLSADQPPEQRQSCLDWLDACLCLGGQNGTTPGGRHCRSEGLICSTKGSWVCISVGSGTCIAPLPNVAQKGTGYASLWALVYVSSPTTRYTLPGALHSYLMSIEMMAARPLPHFATPK
jgi:hypothetical protein